MKPVPFAQFLARQQQAEARPIETHAWPPRSKPPEPGGPPRKSPLLRQVEKAKPEGASDSARTQEQDKLKAFEEGRDAARRELATEGVEIRTAITAEVAKARAQWVEEESGRLAAAHRAAFDAFEQKCAQAVANILRPFLVRESIARVTDALVENLEALFSARNPTNFEISGPPDLLKALEEKFGAQKTRIEFRPDQSIDVRVRAEDTIIETQLGPWLQALGAMTRGGGDE